MLSSTSLHHQEYLKKRRNKRLLIYGLVLIIIASIIGGIAYIAHLPKLRISKVELMGGVLVTQTDIQTEVLSFLRGSYLWLFPKDNAFLYAHDKLENDLKEIFKRIDTIDVKRTGLTALVVNITERKPQALWCSSADEANITKQCFFMDSNGTIFTEAPYFSGDAYFKYYGLVPLQVQSPIGLQYLASSTEFSQITGFVETVRKLSLKPLYLVAKDNSEFSLAISGGGFIYFDMKEPLSKTGENLQALLRTPALSGFANRDLPVEYIDLRFGNKLFYKLR